MRMRVWPEDASPSAEYTSMAPDTESGQYYLIAPSDLTRELPSAAAGDRLRLEIVAESDHDEWFLRRSQHVVAARMESRHVPFHHGPFQVASPGLA